jgi:uncharacterized protein (DUF1778 family)
MTDTKDMEKMTNPAAHMIYLSVEDQRALADAILNPPEPTPALRRAFRRHRKLIKDSRS